MWAKVFEQFGEGYLLISLWNIVLEIHNVSKCLWTIRWRCGWFAKKVIGIPLTQQQMRIGRFLDWGGGDWKTWHAGDSHRLYKTWHRNKWESAASRPYSFRFWSTYFPLWFRRSGEREERGGGGGEQHNQVRIGGEARGKTRGDAMYVMWRKRKRRYDAILKTFWKNEKSIQTKIKLFSKSQKRNEDKSNVLNMFSFFIFIFIF